MFIISKMKTGIRTHDLRTMSWVFYHSIDTFFVSCWGRVRFLSLEFMSAFRVFNSAPSPCIVSPPLYVVHSTPLRTRSKILVLKNIFRLETTRNPRQIIHYFEERNSVRDGLSFFFCVYTLHNHVNLNNNAIKCNIVTMVKNNAILLSAREK